jgi:hypothetical protein
MRLIHRDHVVEPCDSDPTLYQIREQGDEAKTILALAGSIDAAIGIIDDVLNGDGIAVDVVAEEVAS